MALQFHRAVEDIGIWSATSDGFSFVISYASRTGHGLHGRPGFMASWRPLYQKQNRYQDHRLALKHFRRGRGSLQHNAGASDEHQDHDTCGTALSLGLDIDIGWPALLFAGRCSVTTVLYRLTASLFGLKALAMHCMTSDSDPSAHSDPYQFGVAQRFPGNLSRHYLWTRLEQNIRYVPSICLFVLARVPMRVL